ncbi:membrane metallo-endopeptidase-like 1 [Acanthaster planci]|uniref:Membrane metallo-endopeptidase-like 1 n=1 Tax=Acanthaster planci TaxID=133434 RepID=A0A8B7YCN8_ACAPL|nr:membrane metallo-endopeptidase-like 1 [Acanthaster planci]
MDQSKKPCDNFFEYACGGWIERHKVLENRSSFSMFSIVGDDLLDKLKVLFERSPAAGEPGSYDTLRKDYKSCGDMDTINELGTKPLTDLLTSLGGWPVLGDNSTGGNWDPAAFDFEKLWADIRGKYNIELLVTTGTYGDPDIKDKYKLNADTPDFRVLKGDTKRKRRRGTKTLTDEDNEAEDDGVKILVLERYSQKRQAYLQYMIDIAVALGANETVATQDMTDVIDFETNIATMTLQYTDDVGATTSLKDIGQNMIDWVRLYQLMLPESVGGVTGDEPIDNYRPNYVAAVTPWLTEQDDRVKANYMIWRLVTHMVPFMNEAFLAIRRKFIMAQSGVTPSSARWKTCVSTANSQYEFIAGKMYVDDYFPADAKQKTLDMIKGLQAAFKSMLATNDWLQKEDKSVAAGKVDAITIEIGYPEWIKDNAKLDAEYANLTSKENEYFQNSIRYRTWTSQRNLALLRQTVDVVNLLWSVMSPTEVNAFYSPLRNSILFPAAILQPPFYTKELPWYSNYGGIGVVIGHEITHGFDNSGRLFDKDGYYRQWWSQQSINNFKAKAQCIINQYSDFVMPENNKNLDGVKTEGENIADNGGLREAYKAYIDHKSEHPRLPGIELTNKQMFFLSFSQLWCSVYTPAGADNAIENEHSPGRYRVIGPLQNNEIFHAAFNCPAGSYMNPDVKCRVW